MSPATALRIFGLSGVPTQTDLELTRRALLAALHPDTHPGRGHEIFQRLFADVEEAYGVLSKEVVRSRLKDDVELEQSLFQVNASAQWSKARVQRGSEVAAFDRQYAKDKVVAVAVLGLDPRFTWHNTNGLTGGQTSHVGTALYILVWNRTRRRVESLDISSGLLVDDQGNQYSPDGAFYWTEGGGSFNRHGSMLVPNAKLDGFLLYPTLRTGASYYARWYLADSIQVGDKYIDVGYDVVLPREPQQQAMLSGSLSTPLDDDEDDAIDEDDEVDIEDTDEDEALDDDWLYNNR